MIRTAEQMYEDIRKWEYDAGETFLDYFDGSLNEATLLFWAMGKGYIDEEGFKAWEKEQHVSGDDIVYGDEPFSIVKQTDGRWQEEEYEYAMRILGEFLASSDTYQRRVNEFITRIRRVKFDDALKEFRRRSKIFFVIDGVRTDLKDDTPLTADIIRDAQWFIDDSRED